MRRNALLAGVVALTVAAAGVGWFAGSRIQSPAEVAAAAEPPEPSNITVAVVEQELSADVVTRGDITFDDPVQVGLSGSFADQPDKLVVTQASEVGGDLAEGGVAVEVVGRPVFLLTGEIPMYRDLRPGATGEDVLQLEQALKRLGFLPGKPDDTWDNATGKAVAAWYDEAGYRPNGLSDEDEAALAAARDRVRSAESALADARAALDQADEGTSASQLTSAEAEVDAAEDALELARIDADRARKRAADELADAKAALAEAKKAKPPLPASELDALEDAVEEAEFQVGRTDREQESMVDQAASRLDVAKKSLAELQEDQDTSPMQRQVDAAQDELDAAKEEVAGLEAELGTWLPAGEVVFLARLPVRVDQVATSRGSVIDGNFMTVSGSDLTLRASVTERDAPRVEEGMTLEIEHPETGETIPGTVATKADRAGTNGVPSDRVYLELASDDIPQEIVGSNVQVTIPVSSTGGEVLAVPAAALSATADGSTILQVEDDDGSLRTVTVTPGLAAGGLVEVTPDDDDDLAEGDRVVVGTEGPSSGDPSADSTESPADPESTEPESTEPAESTASPAEV